MRQSIERAFGLLTRRWGIFWRPLQCDYGSAELFMNEFQIENVGRYPNNSDNSSLKRLQITEYLKEQGYRRPPHARNQNSCVIK